MADKAGRKAQFQLLDNCIMTCNCICLNDLSNMMVLQLESGFTKTVLAEKGMLMAQNTLYRGGQTWLPPYDVCHFSKGLFMRELNRLSPRINPLDGLLPLS